MDSVTASIIDKFKSIVRYQTSLPVAPFEAEKVLTYIDRLNHTIEALMQQQEHEAAQATAWLKEVLPASED